MLPGFNSPAVGFDQPFDMLSACHERVQRSLALLGRWLAHVDANGHDAQSQSAATDVMRYFDLAAPHHHEDEERHLFPMLLTRAATEGDTALRDAVLRLQADHVQMSALWAQVREVLQHGASPVASAPVSAAQRDAIAAFQALYVTHIPLEEDLVYPAARARLDAVAQQAMGAEMAARRQQR